MKKRRGTRAPRGREGPYTAGVHRFRVQGLKPSSAGLKAGARPQRAQGLAAPEEDEDTKGRAAIAADRSPCPCPRPVRAWQRGRSTEEETQTLPDSPVGPPLPPPLLSRSD